MPAKQTKELAQKIKDGTYYQEARNWYQEKYIRLISHRAILFIILVFLTFSLFLLYLNYNSVKQEQQAAPLIVRISNIADDYAQIKKIMRAGDTPQAAIARYLVTDYVLTREEYVRINMQKSNYKKIQKRIKSTSHKSVLKAYLNYMDTKNPNSPFIKYANHTDREIEITSFKFLEEDKVFGKALVDFTAKIINKNQKPKLENWQAEIHYHAVDVEEIAKTGTRMKFVVGYYNVRKR